MNLDRISRRAAFVIDKTAVIQHREVVENAGYQPNFEAILQALTQLTE